MEDTKSVVAFDDLKLAKSALNDTQAGQHVLDRVCPKVYQIVRMLVGNSNEAEELTQICLVEILQNLQKYRGEGPIHAWAGQLAYRTAMRELKKRHKSMLIYCQFDDEPDEAIEDPEKTVMRHELWQKLYTSIEKIPIKRRTALLLHLVYAYSIPEVAQVTGVSVNTVKDRLKTAYRELRAVLANNTSLRQAILEEING